MKVVHTALAGTSYRFHDLRHAYGMILRWHKRGTFGSGQARVIAAETLYLFGS